MALRSFGRSGVLSALKERQLWRLFSLRSLATAPPESVEVFVNDNPLTVPKSYTVLQACDAAGIDIPRYVTERDLSGC